MARLALRAPFGTAAFSRLLLVVITLFLVSLAATPASALTLHVVNNKGIPQAGAYVSVNGAFDNITDSGGSLNLFVLPGDTVSVSRSSAVIGAPNDACATVPEGPAGVSYVVPIPAPAEATVTLPSMRSLSDPAFAPSLSSTELRMLGLINDLRRSLGREPLQVSTVLTGVADRYLSEVTTHPIDPSNPSSFHCIDGSPWTRAVDAGFPSNQVGENGGAKAFCSAQSLYNVFYAEKGTGHEGHYQNMINPSYTAIGIAQENGYWVTDYGALNLSDSNTSRAGLTGQLGDSSLPDSPDCTWSGNGSNEGDQGASGSKRKSAHLRFKARVHGHRVTLTARFRHGAEGHLVVIAKHIGWPRTIRLVPLAGPNSQQRGKVQLAMGRWTIRAQFVPKPGAEWRKEARLRRVIVL